jgi:DNA (cytosine-5)-methyltransferase 1
MPSPLPSQSLATERLSAVRDAAHEPLIAVSMFSNCGAGDWGFMASGFEFAVLAELEAKRLAVAALNHPNAEAIPGDVRETWPRIVRAFEERYGNRRPDLLSACPPCQGMSSAQSQRGRGSDAAAGSRDHRNLLVSVVGKVARALSPRCIVVENVQAFLSRRVLHPATHEPLIAARLLIDELAAEYKVFPVAMDLCDYGVPQHRRRCFLTFLHRDEPALQWLESTGLAPYPTPWFSPDYGGAPMPLWDALQAAKLGPLDAQNGRSSSTTDSLHFVPVWPPRQYQMVAAIPPMSGGSAWENSTCRKCGTTARSLERTRCSTCNYDLLRPMVTDASGVERLVSGFKNSSYRRMRGDAPAATVTTASGRVGSDNTIHPMENRVLSPRECCLLQTIPVGFDWGSSIETAGTTGVRAMIGEAVPPLFTFLHGGVLRALLRNEYQTDLLPTADRRSVVACEKLALDT